MKWQSVINVLYLSNYFPLIDKRFDIKRNAANLATKIRIISSIITNDIEMMWAYTCIGETEKIIKENKIETIYGKSFRGESLL